MTAKNDKNLKISKFLKILLKQIVYALKTSVKTSKSLKIYCLVQQNNKELLISKIPK